MRELMMQIGISAVNAFETGNLLCGLGLIWFVMAFITGPQKKSDFHTDLYCLGDHYVPCRHTLPCLCIPGK